MATMYRGFSTIDRRKKFRLTDFELVKRDVLNHFQISKGEKLMKPNFGTVIWNLLHEPFTEELKSVIVSDITSIAKYDPRVSIDNIVITEYDRGIQVELNLRYLADNQSALLNLKFDGTVNNLVIS